MEVGECWLYVIRTGFVGTALLRRRCGHVPAAAPGSIDNKLPHQLTALSPISLLSLPPPNCLSPALAAAAAMLKSRRFVKKTKKGAVVTVNREHYLRTDIACGLRHCQRGCTAPSGAPQPLLADKPALVPDTNICLHNADFLEHASITNVILLSTVLEEVGWLLLAVVSCVAVPVHVLPFSHNHAHAPRIYCCTRSSTAIWPCIAACAP